MQTIKVKLSFDYLNSLLVCYHILCCPEKKFQTANKEVYANFKVTKLQANRYNKYIESKGHITKQEKEMYRLRAFTPELKTIKEYSRVRKLPKDVEKDLIIFEKHFKPYFNKLKKNLNKIIKEKRKNIEKIISRTYDFAFKMTGIKIQRFKKIDIRVLEGMSPGSFAKEFDDVQYVIEQRKNTETKEFEAFEMTLVHELVCHQIVKQFRPYFEKIFGKHIYEVEEGFAKLFAKEIFQKVFNKKIEYSKYYIQETELPYYEVYEKNLHKLTNKNFESWYLACLKEIKKKL